MNTIDFATWAAIGAAVFGLAAGIFSVWNARRVKKRLRVSRTESAVYVMVVSPGEDRRYFLSVPDGVEAHTLVDRIASAIEEAGPQRSAPLSELPDVNKTE